MEKHIGHIEYVLYSTEDMSFSIARFVTDSDVFVVRGFIPSPRTNVDYEIEGEFEMHAKYGRQFKLHTASIVEPESEHDIQRFLASGIITGVGESMAELIVRKFGAESLDIIENEPEKLLGIRGIGKRKLEQIHRSYIENISERKNLMFFYSVGIGNEMAKRIIETLGANAGEMVKQNPYLLMEHVRGFAFKKADDVASRLGIEPDSNDRIRAMILYSLNRHLGDGHTYSEERLVLQECVEMGIPRDRAEDVLATMGGRVVFPSEGRIALRYADEAEQNVAEYLRRIIASAQPLEPSERFLEAFQTKMGIGFDERQKEAIQLVFQEGVYAITGGPGTGKTTIVKAIIEAFEQQRKVVMLAAPTGRAAKKLSEATKRSAVTIHRLLGSNGEFFTKNEENQLECDAIIVDEVSMVDIFLMSHLLAAVRPKTRLIFVGDKNQLPSVGAGSVLRDIIASGKIKVITLTHIFRQSKGSMISINAQRIIEGKLPEKGNDFYFFPADIYSDRFPHRVVNFIQKHIPDHFGFDPFRDIQCLSVKYDAVAGVNILNHLLQTALNPCVKGQKANEQQSVTIGKNIFYLGDKVMQTVNNYNIEWRTDYSKGEGIFNGDIGTITEINKAEEFIEVTLDDAKARYSFKEAMELTLAYAITVHKSQGSEYPCIVMPLYPSWTMENRNILYTAVTRAKQLVVLVGDERSLQRFVEKRTIDNRRSTLAEKLQKQ